MLMMMLCMMMMMMMLMCGSDDLVDGDCNDDNGNGADGVLMMASSSGK